MLYISFRSGRELTWHVGEKLPSSVMLNEIAEVQADCTELAYIREHFTNIPWCDNKAVVRWTGDIAEFIAHCLPLDYTK